MNDSLGISRGHGRQITMYRYWGLEREKLLALLAEVKKELGMDSERQLLAMGEWAARGKGPEAVAYNPLSRSSTV